MSKYVAASVGRALAPSVKGGDSKPGRVESRLKNCHLLFPWLAFTI